MLFNRIFYLALVCVVLSWSACEDETGTTDCYPDLAEIPVSGSDNCTPTLVRLTNLGQPAGGDVPTLPLDCPTADELGRVVKIENSGGTSLDLHVYSGIRGSLHLQVFGGTDCDMELTAVTACLTVSAVAEVLTIPGISAYDELFLRIDFSGPGGGAFLPESADFVYLAAYEETPVGEVVDYGGIDGEEIQRLRKSCDGQSYQRVILSNCDPSADVDGWAAETGLPVSERYGGTGGTVVALDIPPGIDPNTVGPALERRRLDQDNDDYVVEADHIIYAPGESSPGILPEAGELYGQEISTRESCLAFLLNEDAASTESSSDQIVVTMIDSGVEFGGEWDDIWANHRNLTRSDVFITAGEYGFDFFRGTSDPADEIGHGTTTAGTLIGNHDGPGPLTVIHHKIFGGDGESTYFGAVVAIYSAVDLGSNIINCSWGYVDNVIPRAMQCAVNYAVEKGAIVVASAGNNTADITFGASPQWPATFSDFYPGRVITVAAFQYTASPNPDFPIVNPDFSNFTQPGSETVSVAAYLTFQTPEFNSNGFTYLAGTSISAPLVSTAIATSLKQSGNLSDYEGALRESPLFNDKVAKNLYLPICPEEQ